MRPPHATGQTLQRSARPAPDDASLFLSRHIPSRREQEARSILRHELGSQIRSEAAATETSEILVKVAESRRQRENLDPDLPSAKALPFHAAAPG